ncbi:glycosyltransferase [Anabaena azotica]|uniref:Glycosyltransferase n=1 Tax=Anabaena azotica FACHB-119 TaxID=947527 RepID=A0ABR8DBX0_9NOST|nr:glycosyltransferase [Anabaena azotica]MBD2503646.1 glycosyltransferase [Anabaena azotica FACHB-119]
MKSAEILVFATKGTKSNEEARILKLLQKFSLQVVPFERANKFKSFINIIQQALQTKPRLIVMEGTGVLGGMACLFLQWFFHIPYVVSSGDAIAPFISLNYPLIVPIVKVYEQTLCRFCAGFIGWTPYLVGRALTFGAPKGVTAAGWAYFSRTVEQLADSRVSIRQQLGIPDDSLVFGLLGSIVLIERFQYCYGYELIKAFQKINPNNVTILVVGDGSGLAYLKQLAGEDMGKRIFLPGNVPYEQVLDYMAAMDVASLPQSVDAVGSFRYTTKLSEYIAARLPVITSQIPMAYDIAGDWVWRLPGAKPWEECYIDALANLMATVTDEAIAIKKQAIPIQPSDFDLETQVVRVTNFITEIMKTN